MHSAEFWIEKLKLMPLPEEGGLFREIYRARGHIPASALPAEFAGERCYSTSIYYLLKGSAFSALHRLNQDEIWHFYDGSPLAVHIIEPCGKYRVAYMGRDPDAGQTLQLVLPAGHIFGATVGMKQSYSLLGCTVAPGFEFMDFTAPSRTDLIKEFPRHAELITRLTRDDLIPDSSTFD